MDPIVQRALDEFGYAQVNAVLKQDMGAASALGTLGAVEPPATR